MLALAIGMIVFVNKLSEPNTTIIKQEINLEELKDYIDIKFEEQFSVENCKKLREKLNGDWWCDYPYN